MNCPCLRSGMPIGNATTWSIFSDSASSACSWMPTRPRKRRMRRIGGRVYNWPICSCGSRAPRPPCFLGLGNVIFLASAHSPTRRRARAVPCPRQRRLLTPRTHPRLVLRRSRQNNIPTSPLVPHHRTCNAIVNGFCGRSALQPAHQNAEATLPDAHKDGRCCSESAYRL